MKFFHHSLTAAAIAVLFSACHTTKSISFKPKEVYKANDLIITQVAENSFIHTSFKQTTDFGYVPCNGLIVRNSSEVVVFDTPTTDSCAEELIRWITETEHCKINAIIPTHFHDDCLGGLNAFHQHQIPSYAHVKTIELARENKMNIPQNGFSDSLVLKAGNEKIVARYFGEGHTKDNIVGYFAADHIVFGGCLIKESGAGKGYLGDANVAAWPGTVGKVKQHFPSAQLVVPGHGKYGSTELFDYTIRLFKTP